MAYFKPYVDSAGLHIPTYNDILEDMIAGMKKIYGDDIYLGNDSADYQLLSIFALKQSDSLQALAYAYNARSPLTAIGSSLDAVVKLNGISRKAASHSTCEIVLAGTPFTQIQGGAVMDKAGLIWDLPNSVTIGSDGKLITTATCREAGAISALVGDIEVISTPTYGWTSVTNVTAAVQGRNLETDAELRQRQALSVSNPSQTMLAGTKGAIAALPNVSRFAVYENDTNTADVSESNPHGLPPHSITCVIEGGSDDDIAQAIYNHKGLGCYTNGSTKVEYTDQNEFVNIIRFDRPTYRDIYVKLVIKKYTGYITSVISQVRTAIYDYLASLTVGSDVSISMLIGVITACNPDINKPIFGIKSITIGMEKTALTAGDIDIAYNEIPNPVYGNIEVYVG